MRGCQFQIHRALINDGAPRFVRMVCSISQCFSTLLLSFFPFPRDRRVALQVDSEARLRSNSLRRPSGGYTMNYWLNLFTGTTWREFKEAGANVSGFSAKQVKWAKRMKPGDIFLCYLTGVMRWAGALEIIGPSADTRRIWKDQEYPVRFAVKPLVLLEPEHGIPMGQLEGRVKFFAGPSKKGSLTVLSAAV